MGPGPIAWASSPARAGPTIQPMLKTASKMAFARGTWGRPTSPGTAAVYAASHRTRSTLRGNATSMMIARVGPPEPHRQRDQRRQQRTAQVGEQHHLAAVPAVRVGARGEANDEVGQRGQDTHDPHGEAGSRQGEHEDRHGGIGDRIAEGADPLPDQHGQEVPVPAEGLERATLLGGGCQAQADLLETGRAVAQVECGRGGGCGGELGRRVGLREQA